MIGVMIVVAAVMIALWRLTQRTETTAAPMARKRVNPQLQLLRQSAEHLYREHRWVAAEKAYVRVLKLDHKNASAYSHLGIIYTHLKNLPDAIECFQIAVRLQPSASTFQNLALAYLANQNPIKAATAFEKAIMFDPSAPRYVGLSRARRQIGDTGGVVKALEAAAKANPDPNVLQLLQQAYRDAKRPADAEAVQQRFAAAPEPRLAQPSAPAPRLEKVETA